jgi:hypothetical protein
LRKNFILNWRVLPNENKGLTPSSAKNFIVREHEHIKPHEPLFRFENVLNQFLRRRGIEGRPNECVERQFEELQLSLVELFAVFD